MLKAEGSVISANPMPPRSAAVGVTLVAAFGIFVALSTCFTAPAEAGSFEAKAQPAAPANPRITRSFERLQRETMTGIEYIEAGPRTGVAGSQYGHAVLRFVDGDADSFNDITLGFVARTPENESDLKIKAKGLSGYYPVEVEALSIAQLIQMYSSSEWRTLKRAIIPTTPEQLRKIIAGFKHFHDDPVFAGRYYFLGRNCATLLQSVLKAAGVRGVTLVTQKPVAVIGQLQTGGAAPWPAVLTKDLTQTAAEFIRQLRISNSDELNQMTIGEFENRLTGVEDTVLSGYFMIAKEKMPMEGRQLFLAEIERRHLNLRLDDIYNVGALPRDLYRSCQDDACITRQIQAANKLWSPALLKKHCALFKDLSLMDFVATTAEQKRTVELRLCSPTSL